jgi:hypothetical protein
LQVSEYHRRIIVIRRFTANPLTSHEGRHSRASGLLMHASGRVSGRR